jgi:hypothetical protein
MPVSPNGHLGGIAYAEVSVRQAALRNRAPRTAGNRLARMFHPVA